MNQFQRNFLGFGAVSFVVMTILVTCACIRYLILTPARCPPVRGSAGVDEVVVTR